MVEKRESGYKPPVLKYKSTAYPQSPNPALPRQYFVGAFIGPRGQGKTYAACQLIRAFEESPPRNPDGTAQDLRTFAISPTYDANECFRALKSLDEKDVHRSYNSGVLQGILDSIEEEKEATERYREEMRIYRKWQKTRRVEDLKNAELLFLDENDFEPPEPPRYPNGVSNYLMVDDMIGTSIYTSGRNPFTNLLLRNRHHRINILLMSQHLKAVPRSVRGNVSLWWVGKFGTRSILPDLYEEVGSALVSEPQFEALYDTATADQYGALVVDFSKPKSERFSQSFYSVLTP